MWGEVELPCTDWSSAWSFVCWGFPDISCGDFLRSKAFRVFLGVINSSSPICFCFFPKSGAQFLFRLLQIFMAKRESNYHFPMFASFDGDCWASWGIVLTSRRFFCFWLEKFFRPLILAPFIVPISPIYVFHFRTIIGWLTCLFSQLFKFGHFLLWICLVIQLFLFLFSSSPWIEPLHHPRTIRLRNSLIVINFVHAINMFFEWSGMWFVFFVELLQKSMKMAFSHPSLSDWPLSFIQSI